MKWANQFVQSEIEHGCIFLHNRFLIMFTPFLVRVNHFQKYIHQLNKNVFISFIVFYMFSLNNLYPHKTVIYVSVSLSFWCFGACSTKLIKKQLNHLSKVIANFSIFQVLYKDFIFSATIELFEISSSKIELTLIISCIFMTAEYCAINLIYIATKTKFFHST